MSSRKATRPELSLDNESMVDIPIMEKDVLKRVPAVIHWKDVQGVDREDDETIGEAIIYEDGTSDVIVWGDISEDAKRVTSYINEELGNYSMEN